MNKIICPVGPDSINGNQVRINAFMVFSLTLLTLFTGEPYGVLVLAIDFFIRGVVQKPYSLLNYLSALLIKRLKIGYDRENKAPKIFAARVGLIVTLGYLLLYFMRQYFAATAMLYILLLFSFLEFAVRFCAGCYVYSFLIKLKWITPKINVR